MSEIQVHPARNGLYYVRIISRNGQVIMHSETYASKSNAMRAAERLQPLMLSATIVDTEAEELKRFTNLFRR